MQNRKHSVRRSSRFPVKWPMRYGNTTFLAEWTVLDLTDRGWRLAGTMLVVPGMRLTLQVRVPDRSTLLHVLQATVLWVKYQEVSIEAQVMDPMDQAWVSEFLYHNLGLKWMAHAAHPEISPPTRSPNTQRALPPRGIPSLEDILQEVLALQSDSTHRPADARWNGESDPQEGESDAPRVCVSQKLWRETHRILRRMVTLNEARARTGQDVIIDN